MNFKTKRIPYSEISYVSSRDRDYAEHPKIFESLIKYQPDISEFNRVIKDKRAHSVDRTLLVEVLEKQYKKVNVTRKTQANIGALSSENCFSIITAHQPTLLTGPLYFIYKIISAINLCERLSETYPEQQFIPDSHSMRF